MIWFARRAENKHVLPNPLVRLSMWPYFHAFKKFLRCFREDLSGDKVDTVDIFVDNQSAIVLAKNPVLHQRTKTH